MTDLTVVPDPSGVAHGLERYQPRDLKQLVWFAGELAKVGMFTKTDKDGNPVALNTAETFFVIAEGVELGLAPLAALRNIYMIEDKHGRRTTIPRADLIAARIQADERTEEWTVHDETPGVVTINAKRRGRGTVSVTLNLSDIPDNAVSRWRRGGLDTQDMLYNRTVRKIARRFFRDMVLGIGSLDGDAELEPSKIIDVGRVEQAIDVSHQAAPYGHHDDCGGLLELQANTRTGGAFLRCPKCNATFPPPQVVRDVIRGMPPGLTITSGQAEDGGITVDFQRDTPSPETQSLPDPEAPLSPGASTHLDEPPADDPVGAGENVGGSLPPDTPETAADIPTPAVAVSPEPEAAEDGTPQAAPAPSTVDAAAPETPPETREAEPAPLTPRDQVRAYLRKHRSATGPHKTAIRDALLDAGWDGTTGISQLCDELSDDKLDALLQAFARPGFGTVQ